MLCERRLFRTRDSWHEAERERNISTSNGDEFSTKCYISLPILAVRKIYSTLFGRQLPFPYKLEWKFVTSNGVLSPNFYSFEVKENSVMFHPRQSERRTKRIISRWNEKTSLRWNRHLSWRCNLQQMVHSK